MLNRYPSVFPARGLGQISQDLEWAESLATPVRDLDIYLNLADEFLGKVDSAHRGALKPLFHYLNSQKQKNQRQMRIALESPRFKGMLRRWSDYLKADLSEHEDFEEVGIPIKEMVGRCVSGLFEDLISQGRTAVAEASDSKLCDVHQISKKLGYQLEVFRSLFPRKKLESLMTEHERLQACLNRFRDLHTKIKTLGKYGLFQFLEVLGSMIVP